MRCLFETRYWALTLPLIPHCTMLRIKWCRAAIITSATDLIINMQMHRTLMYSTVLSWT